MFISTYFLSVFLSLECIQVHNRPESSVLKSKASQLGDGEEKEREEEGRAEVVLAFPLLRGWVGTVMLTLCWPRVTLPGLTVRHFLEPQDPAHLYLPRARSLCGSRTSILHKGKKTGTVEG